MDMKRYKYFYTPARGATVSSVVEASNPMQAEQIIKSRHPQIGELGHTWGGLMEDR